MHVSGLRFHFHFVLYLFKLKLHASKVEIEHAEWLSLIGKISLSERKTTV